MKPATKAVIEAAREFTGDDCESKIPVRIEGMKGERRVVWDSCGECRICRLCEALDVLDGR